MIEGIIDANAGALLRRLLLDLQGHTLRLDFQHVYRINSRGVASLLKFLKEARERKMEVEFEGVSEFHRMLFEMTKISTLAKIIEPST